MDCFIPKMDSYVRIIFFIGMTASLTAAQSLRIRPTSADKSVTRPVRENIVLTCLVDGVGDNVDPRLQWFDDDSRQIDELSGRIYIEKQDTRTLKLYINSIEESDAGAYSCQGWVDGNQVEEMVQLLIFYDIEFQHYPTPQHPAIHTDALIECTVTGQPAPAVSWRYQGNTIPSEGRYSYETHGLLIRDITEDDNGLYQCRAEVEAVGNLKSKDIEVIVYIPPTITLPIGDVEGTEGQYGELRCQAAGKPEAKYEFYRGNSIDSVPVQNSNDGRIQVDRDQGILHFRTLDKSDESQYTCRAINPAGDDTTVGNLRVQVPPRIEELRNITTTEGDLATLICKVNADPPAQMTFRKHGYEVYSDGDNEGGRVRVNLVRDNELHLVMTSATPDDTHNYTCHAQNAVGQVFRNGTIGVQFRPRFADDHPIEFFNWAGARRNMTCFAQGEPEPMVKWYRYGQELRSNETYTVSLEGRHSVLRVFVQEGDSTWVYGGYTCRAQNSLGTAETEITLTRATVPDEPLSVEVRDQTPTMVSLVVRPPESDGGVPINGYRIEYDGLTQDFTIREPIQLINLKPTTLYVFNIRAKNDVGVGPPLDESITTESIRVPYPIVITSEPDGAYPYSYVLHWETPRTGGLGIKHYDFKYRRVEVFEGTFDIKEPIDDYTKITVQDDVDRPMLTYTLENLKPNTYYNVEIVAWNDLGASVPNPSYVFKTAAGANPAASRLLGLSTGSIIGIVIAVFFLFLLIVDVSCYFMNDCGVLMCISIHLCGKTQPGAKERAMEEGESKPMSLEPAIEETKIAPDELPPNYIPTEENHVLADQDSDTKPPIPDTPEEKPDIERLDGDEEDEPLKEPLANNVELPQEEETDEKTPLTDDTVQRSDSPDPPPAPPAEIMQVNKGLEESPEAEVNEMDDLNAQYGGQGHDPQDLPEPQLV